MTREGAKGNLMHAIRWKDMPSKEALEIAIKALEEREPCEDAISREDALMCLTGEIKETDTIETIIARFVRRIRKLPPVKQAKTGHWIEHEIKDTCRWLTCSACGYEWVHKKENFCPNCGACMKDCRTLDEFIEDSKETKIARKVRNRYDRHS